MRTWIFGASCLIAEAIRPNYEYDLTISITMIVLGLAAVLMDALEFKAKM